MMTDEQNTQEPDRQQRKTWKKPELRKLCLSQAAGCNAASSFEVEGATNTKIVS
jgi:hypothetical protein